MNAKQKQSNNAITTDMQLEAGEFPLGHIVHISTVTHAFRGELEAVTPSHYWLKKGTVEIVLSVGALPEYTKTSTPGEAEKVLHQVRISRGAESWMLVLE